MQLAAALSLSLSFSFAPSLCTTRSRKKKKPAKNSAAGRRKGKRKREERGACYSSLHEEEGGGVVRSDIGLCQAPLFLFLFLALSIREGSLLLFWEESPPFPSPSSPLFFSELGVVRWRRPPIREKKDRHILPSSHPSPPKKGESSQPTNLTKQLSGSESRQ